MIMVALRGRVSENFPSETVWKIARGLLGCGHRWCTVSINSASWPLATDLQRPRLCISEFPDSLRREILGNSEGTKRAGALTNASYSPRASAEGDAPVRIPRQTSPNPLTKLRPPLFA